MPDERWAPELDLLDQLLCGPYAFSIALHVFKGDLLRLLTSIRHMQREGLLTVRRDGIDVPEWQIEQWKREVASQNPVAELKEVVVDITCKGARLFYPDHS